MPRLRTIAIVTIAVLLSAGIYINFLLRKPIIVPDSGFYVVSPGSSLNSVVGELTRSGIVKTPRLVFKAHALFTRFQGTIKAGEYQLPYDTSTMALLALMRSGKVAERKITFPEGWSFKDWRDHLNLNEFLTHELSGISDKNLMSNLGSASNIPEGRFFPDTYRFSRGESDIAIVRRAYSRMQQIAQKAWVTRSADTPLSSVDELLVLASMVEKETGFEPDRVYIASVFVNRLKENMKLQSDPTVIYGLPNFGGNLTRAHLKSKTPYNTYVIRGLPPAPICNPGLASIHASLHPAPSSYFYFVARGDGRSEFSTTLAEHNRAVTQYQKASRVSNYRSRPPD